MWTFTDVYRALVDYVVQDLRDGTYKLNWGIVAIAQTSPRAIVRFTLRNVKNNKSKRWTAVIMGETMTQLTSHVRAQVEQYRPFLD